MHQRPSSDAIKERAYQLWEKQKATGAQKMSTATRKDRIPHEMGSSTNSYQPGRAPPLHKPMSCS
jgi:hypothetical protein